MEGQVLRARGTPVSSPLAVIARAANGLRNQNRLNDYINDPVELEEVKQSSLKVYGYENGLTAEEAYKKYGSWKVYSKVQRILTQIWMHAAVYMINVIWEVISIEKGN